MIAEGTPRPRVCFSFLAAQASRWSAFLPACLLACLSVLCCLARIHGACNNVCSRWSLFDVFFFATTSIYIVSFFCSSSRTRNDAQGFRCVATRYFPHVHSTRSVITLGTTVVCDHRVLCTCLWELVHISPMGNDVAILYTRYRP